MAALFSPRYQAEDANGLPYSGALLYFYIAETSTLTTIYQDFEATTPHTNPVVADSAGVFPPIYLPATQIKAVLKTAGGVTLQTINRMASGAGAGYVAGDGIGIDDTDPTAPVISAVPFTGDSGSGGEVGAVPAPAAGDAAANKVLGAGGTWVAAGLPPGQLYGLMLSNNATDGNNDIDIAAGTCRSLADDADLRLTSALTKQLDAAWVVGNNNGGLDTGSKATNTWYFAFLIKRLDTGVVDSLFSTSAVNPVLPTNYTAKRRLGAFKTDGSGNIIRFKQDGGWFHFIDSFEPPATTPTPLAITGTAQSVAIGTPVGIKTLADFAAYPTSTSGTMFFGVCDPDLGVATVYDCVALATTAGEFQWVNVWTNSVGQVSVVANSANGTLRIFTRGWYDARDAYL